MTNHHSHTETSEGSSHVLLRWFLLLRFVLLRENVRHLTSDLCSVQRTLTMNPEFLQFHPIWSRRSCFSTCYFYVYVHMYIGVYSILFLTFSLYFLLLLLFFFVLWLLSRLWDNKGILILVLVVLIKSANKASACGQRATPLELQHRRGVRSDTDPCDPGCRTDQHTEVKELQKQAGSKQGHISKHQN